MKFRTEYNPEKSTLILNPEKPVVLFGSCFSQNMAAKMAEHEWEGVNPAGTLYNPLSIDIAIEMLADGDDGVATFQESLSEYNGVWNSAFFDSSFSSTVKEDCVLEFRHRQRQFTETLKKGKVLVVTFGTSICYYRSEDSMAVGNCHKMPANLFYRQRLKCEEIVRIWSHRISKLREMEPELRIIFTVSPVRHLKDGFSGNSRSKAVLLLAVEEICQQNSGCFYFPAYEILNDDLRDYRFYSEDLAHPSAEAIEYIWEKFIESFVDSTGKMKLEEGSRSYKSHHHRAKTGALGLPIKKGSHL